MWSACRPACPPPSLHCRACTLTVLWRHARPLPMQSAVRALLCSMHARAMATLAARPALTSPLREEMNDNYTRSSAPAAFVCLVGAAHLGLGPKPLPDSKASGTPIHEGSCLPFICFGHTSAWKTLMSLSSPRRLSSKPLSSARVPSSLKTAYRFLISLPSSLLAGRIMACKASLPLSSWHTQGGSGGAEAASWLAEASRGQ